MEGRYSICIPREQPGRMPRNRAARQTLLLQSLRRAVLSAGDRPRLAAIAEGAGIRGHAPGSFAG